MFAVQDTPNLEKIHRTLKRHTELGNTYLGNITWPSINKISQIMTAKNMSKRKKKKSGGGVIWFKEVNG